MNRRWGGSGFRSPVVDPAKLRDGVLTAAPVLDAFLDAELLRTTG